MERRTDRWSQIEAKLLAVSDLLAWQGAVCSQTIPGRTTAYVVRYQEYLADGSLRMRSIYLGIDPLIVDRARKLLADLRVEQITVRELKSATRFARGIVSLASRQGACA